MVGQRVPLVMIEKQPAVQAFARQNERETLTTGRYGSGFRSRYDESLSGLAAEVTFYRGTLDKLGVPVVDAGGRLVGIVTQSDLVDRVKNLELGPVINILDFHLYFDLPSHMFKRVQKMLGTTVGDCMTVNPVTVVPDTPVSKVAAVMAKQKVHTIPVLKEGKILGIIGKMDLVRAVAREGHPSCDATN